MAEISKKEKILPESLPPYSTYLADVEAGTLVSGIALRFDTHSREILVDLGYGVMGIIPEDEATIYDLTFPTGRCTPCEISCLIGRRVKAIVTGHQNGFLLLSRKISMLEGWENVFEGTIVPATVTNVTRTGIFIDVGNGLVSYVPVFDCSCSRYENIRAWFKPGDYVFVKILSKNAADDHIITASIKDAYPTLEENPDSVYEDDIVAVKIATKLDDGYFCEFTPKIPGIIDTSKEIPEGTLVRGVVKKITPKGLKVRYLE